MAEHGRMEAEIFNERGAAPLLLVCEHASNFLPPEFENLGLSPAQIEDHVAWDIGALALAKRLSQLLDAPLVAAPASRLIVDPNRAANAHDLIPESAEGRSVPGNANLSQEERAARIAAFHAPFHEAIEGMLAVRGGISALVAVHSFTPVFFGKARALHAGILHDSDARMADVMLEMLARDANLIVGRNEPYAPSQGVFYTMDRHANGRATVMIEVRNDLIRDEIGQQRWAQRLAEATGAALAKLGEGAASAAGRRS